MGKHVIILGAGASYTSGYPLSRDLRLLLASEQNFQEYLEKVGASSDNLARALKQAFKRFEKALQLFRTGGFATIDEFSFLAKNELKEEVQQIKRIFAWIFALHNPEKMFQKPGTRDLHDKHNWGSGFENSDYYPFIQRLFDEDFHELRTDIAVLTYNYDPYFEFLLQRAYWTRKEAIGESSFNTPTAVLSGLGDLNAAKLAEGDGFSFLKLHGTSVLPTHSPPNNLRYALTFADVFSNKRITIDTPLEFEQLAPPPIFFPWELIHDGKFVAKEAFERSEGGSGHHDVRLSGGNGRGSYYEIFKAIWQRAQREIEAANKISFVGFSAHRFMEAGLRFLFSNRRLVTKDSPRPFQLITACPESMPRGASSSSEPPANGHVDRLQRLLKDVGCGPFAPRPEGKLGLSSTVCYDSFENFIRSEL